jgi:hypothetical protein
LLELQAAIRKLEKRFKKKIEYHFSFETAHMHMYVVFAHVCSSCTCV